jgi:hypothetical protein
VDSSGIAPESSVCRTDVFLLDHEPECSSPASGSRVEATETAGRIGQMKVEGGSLLRLFSSCIQLPRLQPSSSLSLGGKPCFQSDDFRNLQAAGVGIEPTPPGSEPSIATSSDYPAMVVRQVTRSRLISSQIAGAGIEPAPPGSKPSIAANCDYPAM